MTKTIIFWPLWHLFNNFCVETRSLFLCFLFSFCYTKKWGRHAPPTRCCRTFTEKVTTYKRPTGWGINLLLSFPPESTCLNIFDLLNTAIGDLTLDNSFSKHFIVVSLLCCFRGSNNRHDESSRERRNANRYLYPQREKEREREWERERESSIALLEI